MTNVEPVKTGLPPVAEAYQLMVAPGVAELPVRVAVLPAETVPEAGLTVTVGAAGLGLTTMAAVALDALLQVPATVAI